MLTTTRSIRLLLFFAICVGMSAQSSRKNVKSTPAPVTPKLGIKTPGVQIPFASLKAETEFPAPSKPRWIAIADQVYFPGVDALQPIDPKPPGKMQNEPKLAAPIPGLKQPCGGVISAFGHLWAPMCGERALAKIKTNPISRPEAPKPESAKPQSPKPENPKPESAKPDTSKP